MPQRQRQRQLDRVGVSPPLLFFVDAKEWRFHLDDDDDDECDADADEGLQKNNDVAAEKSSKVERACVGGAVLSR